MKIKKKQKGKSEPYKTTDFYTSILWIDKCFH